MDKAPDAYRTISEVAEDLDLPQHVLRFWETRFAQIKPLKRGGGRRYYRPDDVELLKGIRHLLYKEGYTIKGVQRILKEQGVRAVQAFVRETLMAPPAANAPVPAAAPPARPFVETPQPEGWEPSAVSASTGSGAQRHEARTAHASNGSADLEQAAAEPAWIEHVPGAASAIDASRPLPSLPAMEGPVETGEPATGSPSRGQVSMFRGGLQRGEGVTGSGALAEFASQIRERVEHPVFRGDTASLGAREALLMALDELAVCRATIDQILARRHNP